MASKRIFFNRKPFYGILTQGCIINGCTSESFPKEEVFGLVITPRCDLDHEGKVATVHYVPVVPFELWFRVIARPVIKKQWKRELANKLNNEFSSAGAGNIMDVMFSYDDLMKVFNHNSKIKKKNRQRIKENIDAYYETILR